MRVWSRDGEKRGREIKTESKRESTEERVRKRNKCIELLPALRPTSLALNQHAHVGKHTHKH